MANFDQQVMHTVRAPVTGPKAPAAPGQAMPGPCIAKYRFITASGGMVTGATGMVGVSAARAATGIYSLSFPPITSGGDISLFYSARAGATAMVLAPIEIFPYTGFARFNVGAFGGTLINPVANDQIEILFYADPATLAFTVP